MDVPQGELEEPEEAHHGHHQRVHRVRLVSDTATSGQRCRLPHLVKETPGSIF